ncbi:MAG TPA: ribulokinase [Anaerolinea thermolimosa]|uniref:Ribulokinase n=1 Tax=Anaerolinea thermolimosa TaxID=229919 RepID=A0A3D1JJZ8_9CHLR|nr:ribulokinase [Anaerolinea thermolimosa]GAP07089.1 L-ribulokinase [Anaerolinea thermolimosa]HCE18068.1 ribulokinase [Anaerolinea thermolimosa]
MPGRKFTIGIDFGTELGRAVLVDVSDGTEIATAVHPYANGVIDEQLPGMNFRLEPDWALQDPGDYIQTLKQTIPALLKESGVKPEDVIGIGIDFTACTMLPTLKDGTPLCFLPAFRNRPHAWVKLWKHHAAQPEANILTQIARDQGYSFLDRYGGKISSEWFFPKAWQILNEDPEVYVAAERLIEAADWIVWQLTGVEKRNSCAAGYKALWSKRQGFPPDEFFKALDPRLEPVLEQKMSREVAPLGQCAGFLTPQAASWTGLKPGTAVAVGNVDAHVSVPASTVIEPGRMVMIMGTSICHMVLSKKEKAIPGICGYVEDGIIPGFIGYEAGQSCVGDLFAWFVKHCVPEAYHQEARNRGIDIHALLEEKAARQKPGESGLLALDWWNGNRSVLVDVDLTGFILGMTLHTRPEEIYRALIEATAYGTRLIIETFVQHGVTVHELIATGGLPDRNPLLMQIYSDITGKEIRIAAAKQTPALGSAMFGAVAAGKAVGGYDSIYEASQRMAHLRDEVYRPIPENTTLYNRLYKEYLTLHDYFGRGANEVMKRLKALKMEVRAQE